MLKGIVDLVHIFDHVVARGAHFHGLFVLQFLRLQATHIGVQFRELRFHGHLDQARKLLSSPSRNYSPPRLEYVAHRYALPVPPKALWGYKRNRSSCCGRRKTGIFTRFKNRLRSPLFPPRFSTIPRARSSQQRHSRTHFFPQEGSYLFRRCKFNNEIPRRTSGRSGIKLKKRNVCRAIDMAAVDEPVTIAVTGRYDDADYSRAKAIATAAGACGAEVAVTGKFETEWLEDDGAPLIVVDETPVTGVEAFATLVKSKLAGVVLPEDLASKEFDDAAKNEFLAALVATGNQIAYHDVKVGEFKGKRVFYELYGTICPKTCENFAGLCKGVGEGQVQRVTVPPRRSRGAGCRAGTSCPGRATPARAFSARPSPTRASPSNSTRRASWRWPTRGAHQQLAVLHHHRRAALAQHQERRLRPGRERLRPGEEDRDDRVRQREAGRCFARSKRPAWSTSAPPTTSSFERWGVCTTRWSVVRVVCGACIFPYSASQGASRFAFIKRRSKVLKIKDSVSVRGYGGVGRWVPGLCLCV